MFMSILCCCLPVFHPILPTNETWTRLLSTIVSLATFGQVTHDPTTHNSGENRSTKSSKDSGNIDPMRRQYRGWRHLDEDNNISTLAWPDTIRNESHTMREFPTSCGRPAPDEAQGINFQKQNNEMSRI